MQLKSRLSYNTYISIRIVLEAKCSTGYWTSAPASSGHSIIQLELTPRAQVTSRAHKSHVRRSHLEPDWKINPLNCFALCVPTKIGRVYFLPRKQWCEWRLTHLHEIFTNISRSHALHHPIFDNSETLGNNNRKCQVKELFVFPILLRVRVVGTCLPLFLIIIYCCGY